MKQTEKAIRTARETAKHQLHFIPEAELASLWNVYCDEYLQDPTAIVCETELVSFLVENSYLESTDLDDLLAMFFRSCCDFANDDYWTTKADSSGDSYFCTGSAYDLIGNDGITELADWLVKLATGEAKVKYWYCDEQEAMVLAILEDIKRILAE